MRRRKRGKERGRKGGWEGGMRQREEEGREKRKEGGRREGRKEGRTDRREEESCIWKDLLGKQVPGRTHHWGGGEAGLWPTQCQRWGLWGPVVSLTGVTFIKASSSGQSGLPRSL